MASWEEDNFDENGKLTLLYRHQRFIDEGFMGDKVLDIGGWGKLAFRLIQEGKEVLLLDIDRLLLKKIKERFKGVQVVLSDAHKPPFINEVFDTVHCSETLEHIRLAKVVSKEAYRILRNGGIFCGTVPIPDVVHKRGELGITFYSRQELAKIISRFKIITIQETPSIKPEDAACSIMFVCQR